MRQRPAKGQAFLCANDALVLLDIYIHGQHQRPCTSTTRSLHILVDNGTINPDLTLTAAGTALVKRILELPCR